MSNSSFAKKEDQKSQSAEGNSKQATSYFGVGAKPTREMTNKAALWSMSREQKMEYACNGGM